MTKLFGAALLAGATLIAGPASAEIVTFTFTGTVQDGNDGLGVFGAPGADISGLAYTSVYTIDTDRGTRTTHDMASDDVIGGASYGDSGPVSAVLTIDGKSFSVGGDYYGEALTEYGSTIAAEAYDEDYDQQGNLLRSNEISDSVVDSSLMFPYRIDQVGSYSFPAEDSGSFYFDEPIDGRYHVTTGGLIADSLNVSVDTPAVPESATWAMMIAGFGLVGGGARLRARRPALAAV